MTFPFDNQLTSKVINISSIEIKLNVDPDVFIPSEHGTFLAQNIIVGKSERVLDVGTGSGFLAILAAKLGAIVVGIDNDDKAIVCAKKNAIQNNVDITFKKGDLLTTLSDNYFDVVIANLPQEIIPPILLEELGEIKNNAIYGGEKGNNIMIEFLQQAYKSMEENKIGRIYLKINTLSFYRETLNFILDKFHAKLINFDVKQVKKFVLDYEDFYEPLNRQGKIHIFNLNGNLYEENFIFELSKNIRNNNSEPSRSN